MSHTPGPWVASRFGFQVLTGDSWSTICTLRGGAKWKDGRGTYEPYFEWQNQAANACLIAAAPDLLAEVEREYAKLANVRNQWPGRDTSEGQARLSRLRDLISRATGRDAQEVQDALSNQAEGRS